MKAISMNTTCRYRKLTLGLTRALALVPLLIISSNGADPTQVIDGSAVTVSGSQWEILGDTLFSTTYTVTPNGGSVTGTWSATNALIIGSSGTGSLAVAGNGTLATTGRVVIGDQAGSLGEVTIASGGVWNFTPSAYASEHGTVTSGNVAFEIGSLGTGVLTIDSGGTAIGTGQITLGLWPGSTGTLFVNGYLKTNLDLQMGGYYYNNGPSGGNGTVVVGSSGTLITGNIRIGYGSIDTTGTMIVNAGGYAQSAYIYVGHWGQGYYYLGESGTQFIGSTLTIGAADDTSPAGRAAAIGTAVVDGVLTATTTVVVGRDGIGSLSIGNTGTVRATTSSAIGSNATGSGSASVGGVFDIGTSLTVGASGKGFLSIASTGTVIARTNIAIGSSGEGTLVIAQGGVMKNTGTAVGNYFAVGLNAGSSGTAIISGFLDTGTRTNGTNDGNLIIGHSGTGYMRIEEGATVLAAGVGSGSAALTMGKGVGSYGYLNVAGLLDMHTGGYARIGIGGSADVEIASTGTMLVAYQLQFGYGAFSTLKIAEGGALRTGQFDTGADIGYVHLRSVTADVAGLFDANGSFHLAPYNGENAFLDIAQSGTVLIRSYTTIGGFYATSTTASGTANVAGVFKMGTNLVMGGSNGTAGAGTNRAVLNIAPTGTTIVGGYAYIGSNGNSTGIVDVAGKLDVGGNLAVGYADSSTGVLTIQTGGVVNQTAGWFRVGGALNTAAVGSSGTLIIQTGGTYTGVGALQIGSNGTGYARIEGYASTTDNAYVGTYAGGQGVIYVGSGGIFSIGKALSIAYNTASGTVFVEDGGTVNVMTNLYVAGQNGGSSGHLDIASGGFVSAGGTTFIASDAASTGTLVLAGVLQTGQIAFGAGNVSLVLNGGTLRAAADTVDFLNMPVLNMGADTLNLDTQAFTVTATNGFAGNGTLAKLGAGALSLAGDSSAFAGTVDVRKGSLDVGSTAKVGGVVAINSGAAMRPTVAGGVVDNLSVLAGGALDLRNASLSTGAVTLADGALWQYSLTGTHQLDVTGALAFLGSGTLLLDRGTLEVGDITIPSYYTLATYGSVSGDANLAGWSVEGTSFTASGVIDALTPGKIMLTLNGASVDFLTWQGGDGIWDAATVAWTRSGSPVAWADGAFAVFNTGTGSVTVDGLQNLNGLQFGDLSNSVDYTLGGTGTLTASSAPTVNVLDSSTATINATIETPGLRKTGSGALVLGGVATLTDGASIENGSLTIAQAGALNATSVAIATAAPDASLSVAGLLDNSGDLIVGEFADAIGALDIAATGTVNSASAVIASDADSIGSATVAGLLNNTGALTVGASGAGTLDIATTGTAKSTSVTIGDAAGSTGAATVAGLLDGTGALVVGNAGAGDLAIASTGTVTVGSGYIGNAANSTGAANVAGSLIVSTSMMVGNAGFGSMDIVSGGTVKTTGLLAIGQAVDSSGTVSVAGVLDVGTNIYVGNAGAGTLEVLNGGTVFLGATRHQIGDDPTMVNASTGVGSGSGALIIRSGGVVLAQTGMNVARYGTGELTVETGGTLVLDAAVLYIAGDAGRTASARGTVNIDGFYQAGGDGTYYQPIGYSANAVGVFNVGATGTALTGYFQLGREAGATGTATVAGYWLVSGAANEVGSNGSGALIIEETGTMVIRGGSNGDYLLMARYDGSDGNIIVRGLLDTGTRNHASNANLYVGYRGTDVMTIESTGTVIASGTGADTRVITVGHGSGAQGTLNVAGYLRTITGNMLVGNSGDGILNIASTGTVIVDSQYAQTALGTLGIELDPSRTDAYITANSAQLGGTLNLTGAGLDYAPVARSSELSGMGVLVLTATSGTITGNFAAITGMGGAAPDYLLPGGFIITDESTGFADYRAAYRLAWNGPSSAHGTFTIADGETFEVDTPLGDRVGEASPSWDKKSLTKSGAGTLVLSAENTFTGTLAITSGTVRLGGPELHRFGSLANDGVFDFGTPATIPVGPVGIMAAPPSGITYRTVEVGSLSGNGTLQMTVNPGTGESDRLIVLGKATGAHHINLTASADATAPDGGPAPILTTINGTNSATFTGGLDFDGTNYAIVPASGGNLILATNGQAGISDDVIPGVPGAQSIMWFASQDNLTRRLGELRAPDNAPAGEFALWARARAEHASLKSSADMRAFKMDLHGFELGADKTLPLTNDSRLVIGGYFGYGRATQDFRPNAGTADGESIQTGLGLYAAWLHDTGWFTNLTLSAARFKNELNSADQSGRKTTGDHRDDALGASLEVGKRIALDRAIGKGWFAEPAAQASIARLERGDYDTTGANTLRVTGKDIAITRLRASVKAGRLWPLAKGMMELSGRLGASHEDSSGGEIQVNGHKSGRPNVDGTRAEAGVGLIWRPMAAGQLYFDYEFATGDRYEKPWSVSLGYRHGF